MRRIDIEIPEDLYNALIDKFGSKKRVEDLINYRLEASIRKQRYLINKSEDEIQRMATISVYIKEYLYPYFNAHLINLNLSKQNFIVKILRRLLRGK